MKLSEAKNKIDFDFFYTPTNDTVTIIFKQDNTEQDFSSFYNFIVALGIYYKSIVDFEVINSEKIQLCNTAILDFENYLYTFERRITNIKLVKNEVSKNITHFSSLISHYQSFELSKTNIEVKLKWLAKPALLGHLFTELFDKGYIEMPVHNGTPSYNKYGKMVYEMFEFKGEESSLLNAFNPKKNTLSGSKKQRFKIPPLNEMN